MKTIILIFLAILPAIVLWKYLNKLDLHKEPVKVLKKLFLSGTIAIIITIVISIVLSLIFTDFFEYEVTSSLTGFLYCLLGIALVEELSKFLMMYAFGWHEKNMDETYDVILYSMIVALGFATTENIFYSLDKGFIAAIFRIFTAVPGHVIDGAFMGYFLCNYRLNSNNKKNLILSILVPTILHGLYDFIAFTSETVLDIVIFLAFVITEFIIAKKLVKKMAKNSKYLPFQVIYCPNCGYRVNTRFCPNCGKER